MGPGSALQAVRDDSGEYGEAQSIANIRTRYLKKTRSHRPHARDHLSAKAVALARRPEDRDVDRARLRGIRASQPIQHVGGCIARQDQSLLFVVRRLWLEVRRMAIPGVVRSLRPQ